MFSLTGHTVTEPLSLRIKYFDHTCFHSTAFKMPFSVLLNKQVTNMHKYSCLKTIKRDGRQTTDSVLRARQHRPSAIALISWCEEIFCRRNNHQQHEKHVQVHCDLSFWVVPLTLEPQIT